MVDVTSPTVARMIYIPLLCDVQNDEKPSVYDREHQQLHWKAHKEDCKAMATAAEANGRRTVGTTASATATSTARIE